MAVSPKVGAQGTQGAKPLREQKPGGAPLPGGPPPGQVDAPPRLLTAPPHPRGRPHFVQKAQGPPRPAPPFCPLSSPSLPEEWLGSRRDFLLSSQAHTQAVPCTWTASLPHPAPLIPTPYENLILNGPSSKKPSLIGPVRGPPQSSHNTPGFLSLGS